MTKGSRTSSTPATSGSASLRGFWGLAAAQFLGAFNDNALRWFLIALAMREVSSKEEAAGVMSAATTVFLLPFILFSMHAGSLADHFSKRRVLMLSKAAEVFVMLFCMVGLLIGQDFDFILPYLLVGLFLMGAQSTYYSPAKFGVLPEILPEERLSWGNGIFEMTGMLAIISGSIFGAECVGMFTSKLFFAPLCFAVAAALGFVATCFVPPVPPAAPHEPVRINPLPLLKDHIRVLRNKILLATLLSVVAIWSLGVLFQLNVALYAKENLGFAERHTALPMGTVAVGVAVGTVLAGHLSGRTIEMGLVPLGATGIAAASVLLYFTSHSLVLTFLAVTLLGIFAGFFIVPNHAFLQEESPLERKGSVWAATNFLQTCGMLVAAEIFGFFHGVLKLSAPEVFLVSGVGIFLLACCLFIVLPESLARTVVWFFLLLRGGVRVVGQEHIPVHGPLVFLIRGAHKHNFFSVLAGTRRFIRFVLPSSFLRDPFVAFCARNLKALVIEENRITPEALQGKIKELLAQGESVGLLQDNDPADSRNSTESLLPPDHPRVNVTIRQEGRSLEVHFASAA